MTTRRTFLQTTAAVAASAPLVLGLNDDEVSAREKTLRLPKSDAHYQWTSSYIENEPDSDYRHASAAAYEAFRDIKFSIRIHWGVYAKWGIEASLPFVIDNWTPEKRMEYNNLYKTFNPVKFDADKWMLFFKRCGMQAFAFICKHCDGLSLWHTKTRVKCRANYLNPSDKILEPCDLAYSIEETPFKRDIVKELCDAGRKHNLKIDLYYSHPDWYDADFRPYVWHPLTTPYAEAHPENYYNAHSKKNPYKAVMSPNKTPEEYRRMVLRHREQIHELLTNYGKVDMMCFDMWLGKDNWADAMHSRKWTY